jgi:CRISPR-associated protein (TIGR03986 family)
MASGKGQTFEEYRKNKGLPDVPREPENRHGAVQQEKPNEACAPFGFVPPPGKVALLEGDLGRVSHDVPFRGGLSGKIAIELEATTPIFLPDPEGPDGKEAPQAFFRTPDGKHAIPGSTLRGAFRSVVEIASFSRLGPVGERFFSLRDLQGAASGAYTKPMSNVSAGWLHAEKGSDEQWSEWTLQPCNYARFPHKILKKVIQGDSSWLGRSGKKQGEAHLRYGKLGMERRRVKADLAGDKHGNARKESGFSRVGKREVVIDAGPGASTEGMVVLTGQIPNKKCDWFFHGEAGERRPVSEEVRRKFLQVHRAGGEQHALGGRSDKDNNEEWNFWSQRLGKEPIPVFYLASEGGGVLEIGLASMFRRPGALDACQAARNAGQADDSKDLDMAEAIFGRVLNDRSPRFEDAGSAAIRGRAVFSTAFESPGDGAQAQASRSVTAVFGAPKPQFYPWYLQQHDLRNATTWLDDGAQVAGWKRYHVRNAPVWKPELPPKTSAQMTTSFSPLPAGTRFTAALHVHNLRPFELGALLWALEWGGREECRHAIGKGKPLGFGAVKVTVTGGEVREASDGQHLDAGDGNQRTLWRDAFRHFMESHSAGWEMSPTVQDLLALAVPYPAKHADSDLRYLRLEEFRKIKPNPNARSGPKDLQVLPAPRFRLKEAGGKVPGAPDPLPEARDLIVFPSREQVMTSSETEDEKVTVPPSGAAAEYQEAWDSGGFKSVSELAHDWLNDSGSEQTNERKKIIEKWTLGLSRQKKSKIQDIIDWCKE